MSNTYQVPAFVLCVGDTVMHKTHMTPVPTKYWRKTCNKQKLQNNHEIKLRYVP